MSPSERARSSIAWLAVLACLSILLVPVAWWMGGRLLSRENAETDAARAQLMIAEAATEKARKDHANALGERDSVRAAREKALSTAARERRDLTKRKASRDASDDAASTERAQLAEAAVAIDLTTSFLESAQQAAAQGGEVERKQFRAALDEAARLIEYQDVERGGVMLPELNLAVAKLLLEHGPQALAGPLLERAIVAGKGLLTPAQQFDAGVGIARSRLWAGDVAGARSALRDLPPVPDDLPPAQRLALATARGETAWRGDSLGEAETAFRDRLEVARATADSDPQALHDAVHALARLQLIRGRPESAEVLLREQLAREDASTRAGFLTRVLLAWSLLERGRLDEGGQLDDAIRAVLAADPVVPDVIAEPLVSDYLIARRGWPLAERALAAQWERSVAPSVSPHDRERIATQFIQLHEATGNTEMAATWRRTLLQLQGARTLAPGRTP